MAQTNTFRELMNCSAPPPVHSREFLPWVYEYIERRKAPCMFKRSTVYFINSETGSDSNNGTSAATPWKTTDKVRTIVEAGATNTAFLFNRNMEHLVTGGNIAVTTAGNMFGSYGNINNCPTYTMNETGLADIYSLLGSYVCQKPILSFWTMRWYGGTSWVRSGSTDRWTNTVADADENPNIDGVAVTRVGWLRIRGVAPISTSIPLHILKYHPLLKAVDSTAKVEAQPYSWYCDTSGNVSVNLGDADTIDANDYVFEGVPHTAATTNGCFDVQDGGTNTLFQGLILDGFDCTAWAAKNGSGIRFNQSNDDVACAIDCESYWNGRHAMSSEHQNTGGYAVIIGGRAGLCNPIYGSACFNSYGSGGNHETVFQDCAVSFGDLPNDVTGTSKAIGISEARCTQPWYGHVGFTGSPGSGTAASPVGLYINIGGRVEDNRDKFPSATANLSSFDFDASKDTYSGRFFDNFTDKTPGSGRAYVIDYLSETHEESDAYNESYFGAPGPLVFVNSIIRVRRPHAKTFGNNPPALHTTFWAYCLNCILEYTWNGHNAAGASNNIGQIFKGAVSTASLTRDREARLMNCLLLVRGSSGASIGASDFIVINHGEQGEDLIRLANTVVVGERWQYAHGLQVRMSNAAATAEALNDTNSLRYVAIAGCLAANTGNWRGFDQATGFVNLDTTGIDMPLLATFNNNYNGNEIALMKATPRSLSSTSQLLRAGSQNPFADKSDMTPAPKYDFWGRSRPFVPSIGPFDRIVGLTGASGQGAGSFIRPFVGSFVGS